MDKNNTWMKRVMFVSFAVLVFGGLNYLLMGLFEFDMFAEMFGGMDSIASRIFYLLFGLAAVTLATIVIWKSFYSKHSKPAAKKATAASTSAS